MVRPQFPLANCAGPLQIFGIGCKILYIAFRSPPPGQHTKLATRGLGGSVDGARMRASAVTRHHDDTPRRLRLFTLATLCAGFSGVVLASPSSGDDGRVARAVRATTPISLDGRLDEPPWQGGSAAA